MNPYLPFAALPLAVTAAWFAASNWAGSEPGRYRVPPVAQIEDPLVPSNERTRQIARSDIRVDVFLPRRPARPPAPVPTLILYSVMTGSDVHLATINGQLVREGDSIEGYRVKRITADGVDLTRAGKNRRLPMRPLHELPGKDRPASDLMRNSASVRYVAPGSSPDFAATQHSPQSQL